MKSIPALKRATFRFRDSLNDFLPDKRKNKKFNYYFRGKPNLKDAIQAMGVPHCEVNYVIADYISVPFQNFLNNGNDIEVYPNGVFPHNSPVKLLPLYANPDISKGLILDVQLGKLAKFLRILGIDAIYKNDYGDQEIASTSASSGRLILTRDVDLLKLNMVEYGYWVRETDPEKQFTEVLSRFFTGFSFALFSRCLICNHTISAISKEEIVSRLKPKTCRYFDEFYYCSRCDKIFWKGSHYEHMQKFLSRILPKGAVSNSTN